MALTSKGELWSWGRCVLEFRHAHALWSTLCTSAPLRSYQPSNWPKVFAESWCNGYESKGEFGIKGEVIMQCSAGEAHMAVLTKSQKVFTWGYNEQFQVRTLLPTTPERATKCSRAKS